MPPSPAVTRKLQGQIGGMPLFPALLLSLYITAWNCCERTASCTHTFGTGCPRSAVVFRGNCISHVWTEALFSMSSRPIPGSTRPPIQWVPGDKAVGASNKHRDNFTLYTDSVHEIRRTKTDYCRIGKPVRHLLNLW
jgi:hypothetical protein